MSLPETETILELPHKGIPTIVISNHIFSAKQLPSLLDTKKKRNDVNLICNAGFAYAVEAVGINAIPVDSITHIEDQNVIRTAWARLVKVSRDLYIKKHSIKIGHGLIENATERLKEGKLVWITPAGKRETENEKPRWKNGVGHIIAQCIKEGINPQIVFYQIDSFAVGKVKKVELLSSFLEKNFQQNTEKPNAMQIVAALRNQFGN